MNRKKRKNKNAFSSTVISNNKENYQYPLDKTISQLFEEQVVQYPENIAIYDHLDKVTYRELNERANQLARYLRKQYKAAFQQEMPAGILIAVYLDRSIDLVIGLLGILKAGGAYVPLDISGPIARTHVILQDTQAIWVLTHEEHAVHFPHAISLDQFPYQFESHNNLKPYSQSHDRVYVIYTSGTTGKPKGVVVCHQSVINTLFAVNERFKVCAQDKVLLTSA